MNTSNQVRVLRVIARLNVGGPAWNAVLLTARTRARYPTLLAVGAIGPKEADMSGLAAQHGVVPVRVHTYHGHVFRGYFGRWETALYIALERLLARITTRIVAISPLQAEELGRYLKVRPEKI